MNYYVVIPAYQPDMGLIDICHEVCEHGHKTVVVDDGSGDEYRKIFDLLDKRAVILRHEVNRGKGAGMKTAIEYISKQEPEGSDAVMGFMDADGQHLLKDMESVLRLASENPGKLALGVRVIEKMPKRSVIGNKLAKGFFRLLTGSKVSDTQTGLRAVSVSQAEELLDIEGDRYEYEMNMLVCYAKKKHCIVETPIEVIYRDEQNSTTHFRTFKDAFRVGWGLAKFAGSSILSFIVDYSFFCLFLWLFAFASDSETGVKMAANVSARVISATFNYFLNCRAVFHRKQSVSSALKYAALCVFIIAVNCGVLYLWGCTGLPTQICKVFTEICMFFVSYTVQKKFIFNKKKVRRKNQ